MIGESTLAYQRSILSGMDAMTRLVINLSPNASAMDIEESLVSDLRVAVHQQNPEEFLSDISHHTLNLVVLGYKEISIHLIRQIYAMLVEGGSVILLRSSQFLNAEIDEELCALSLGRYWFVQAVSEEVAESFKDTKRWATSKTRGE